MRFPKKRRSRIGMRATFAFRANWQAFGKPFVSTLECFWPYENLSVIPRISRSIIGPELSPTFASASRVQELLFHSPFLNSGFAAGAAGAMTTYFAEAARLRKSPALAGTADWGDQTALNLYCHSNPERWLEIPETWNFCLYQRRPRDFRCSALGMIRDRNGAPMTVVHGNGGSFKRIEHPLPIGRTSKTAPPQRSLLASVGRID